MWGIICFRSLRLRGRTPDGWHTLKGGWGWREARHFKPPLAAAGSVSAPSWQTSSAHNVSPRAHKRGASVSSCFIASLLRPLQSLLSNTAALRRSARWFFVRKLIFKFCALCSQPFLVKMGFLSHREKKKLISSFFDSVCRGRRRGFYFFTPLTPRTFLSTKYPTPSCKGAMSSDDVRQSRRSNDCTALWWEEEWKIGFLFPQIFGLWFFFF